MCKRMNQKRFYSCILLSSMLLLQVCQVVALSAPRHHAQFNESIPMHQLLKPFEMQKVLDSDNELVLLGDKAVSLFGSLATTQKFITDSSLRTCVEHVTQGARLLDAQDFFQALVELTSFNQEHELRYDPITAQVAREVLYNLSYYALESQATRSIGSTAVLSQVPERSFYVCKDVTPLEQTELTRAFPLQESVAASLRPAVRFVHKGDVLITCDLCVGKKLLVGKDLIVQGKILTNEIDPLGGDGNEDPNGFTCFSGNVSIPHDKLLLVNEINPRSVDDCTLPDETLTTSFSGNVYIDKDLKLSPDTVLLVNHIDPVDEFGNHDNDGFTCFSGNVTVTFGKLLLVNEINPTSTFDCTIADDTRTTTFSGNVFVDKNLTVSWTQKLLVNEIDPVNALGQEDDTLTTSFSGNVFVDKTLTVSWTQKLLVNEINPVNALGQENDNGFTCFSGNVSVPADKLFLVNEINPTSTFDCRVADDTLTTSFSGHVFIDKTLTLSADQKILVNEIDPVNAMGIEDDTLTTSFSGNVFVDKTLTVSWTQKLLVNEINPVNALGQEDDSGFTCFSGNVSVPGDKLFLVNEINPTSTFDCRIADDTLTTTLSGFVHVKKTLGIDKNWKLLVNEIDPINCEGQEDDNLTTSFSGHVFMQKTLTVSGNVTIIPPSILFVNEINPVDENGCPDDELYTCFSGNVGFPADKEMLINRICPVDANNCRLADINGTTTFTGFVHVDRTLTVDESVCAEDDVKAGRDVIAMNNVISLTGDICALGVGQNGNVKANNDVCSLNGNIKALDGNVCAFGLTPAEGNVKADFDVMAGRDVKADRNVDALCNVTAKKDVVACVDVISQTGSLVAQTGGVTANMGTIQGLNLLALNNVTATNNVSALNNVTAVFDVSAMRNIVSGCNITAVKDITAGQNLFATLDLTVGRNGLIMQDFEVCGQSRFKQLVKIDFGHKLLVNEINPINPMGFEDDTLTTTLSGNVAINGDLTLNCDSILLVNEINPVDCNGCPADDEFTCFSGNVGIPYDKILHVNEINPASVGDCRIADETLTTSFSGNVFVAKDLGVDFEHRLLVNEINPIDAQGQVDDDGFTCFSGNVSVSADKILLVNNISPVDPNDCTVADPDGTLCFGQISIDPTKLLLVNEINPVDLNDCTLADDSLTTSFSGFVHVKKDLGVAENWKLLVNEINPIDSDGFADDAGFTCFSGNVSVSSNKILLVNEINPASVGDCTQPDDTLTTTFSGFVHVRKDVSIEDGWKLLVNEINPIDGQGQIDDTGFTCFSGNVSVSSNKILLVNEINPASIGDCTVADDTLTTTFSGFVFVDKDVCINSNHQLCVNKIIPVDVQGQPDPNGTIQLCGDVCLEPSVTLSVNMIDTKTTGTVVFKSNVCIEENMTLSVNRIAPKIPGDTVCIDGDLKVTGFITELLGMGQPSDQRVKEEIEYLSPDDSLERIMALVPRTFKYTEEFRGVPVDEQQKQVGLIAQEVKSVIPEVVHVSRRRVAGEVQEEFHSLDYSRLVTDLIGAVQAAYEKIVDVEEMHKREKKEMSEQIERLEKIVQSFQSQHVS